MLMAYRGPGECQRFCIGLMYTYYLSLWLYHFYGHEGYRKDLRKAVKGLIHLSARAQDARQKRHIERLLRRVLTHQLDWSLDDLELDSTERQIVDRLADLPATNVAHAVHCRGPVALSLVGMWTISAPDFEIQ